MTEATESAAAAAAAEGTAASEAEGVTTETSLLTATEGAKKGAEDPADKAASEGEEGGKEKTDGEGEELTPESYGDFALPDGFEPIPEIMDEFKAYAAAHKIDKAEAQKLVDLQVKLKQVEMQRAAATVQQWATDARADKEIGGADFDKNLGAARAALSAFGNPELLQLLDQTGLGNHKAVIGAFVRIGKAMAEDGRIASAGGGSAPREMTERDYMASVFNKGKKE